MRRTARGVRGAALAATLTRRRHLPEAETPAPRADAHTARIPAAANVASNSEERATRRAATGARGKLVLYTTTRHHTCHASAGTAVVRDVAATRTWSPRSALRGHVRAGEGDMSTYDALDGSRYEARPAFHKNSAARAWGHVGEPEPEAVKPAAPPKALEPQTRVAPCASRALPGLVVADGVCSVEDQDQPADAVRRRPPGECALTLRASARSRR